MESHQSYGSDSHAVTGGLVADVLKDGPAYAAGIRVGDTVLAVDDHAVSDIIDWRWYTADNEAVVSLRSSAGELRDVSLHREPQEMWGIDFEDVLFDGVRECVNSCAFCFMTQLPRGMRSALYVRDDDFRLSFLQGNFVTLTNLSDDDTERIIEQRLSPLHVSLHAVDPDVRAELIGRSADLGLKRLEQLLDHGIDVHVQIVAVPGVNDGQVLERSLRWLAEREGIESVGIVPLGYTGHQTKFTSSYEGSATAAALLDEIEPWQHAYRERDGIDRVYAADEFYLNAGRPVPEWARYDGFPQYENGIGMVRAFIDEFAAAMSTEDDETHDSAKQGQANLVFVSGTLFAPVLQQSLSGLDQGVGTRVLPVSNVFFGGNVSVTGLLTGRDIIGAIRDDSADAVYLVPDVIFNADELTLDGMTAEEIARESAVHVRVVSCSATGAAQALLGR